MDTGWSDLDEDACWRRHQDELDAMPNRGEMKPLDGTARCLKCGHGIEISHVCKLSPNRLRAQRLRDLRREELQNEKLSKGSKLSVLFGKRRSKTKR